MRAEYRLNMLRPISRFFGLFCWIWFVVTPWPSQGKAWIIDSGRRPKAIGQMSVQDIDQINKGRSKINASDARFYLNSGSLAILQSGPDSNESRAYSRELLALNSDDMASIAGDDRATGDSLYGWALKIHGVNLDTILRNGICGCDHPRQAEFCIDVSAIRTLSAEREADDRDVGTWRNFIVGPELKRWKTSLINFQKGKITERRILVDENPSQRRGAIWQQNGYSGEPLAGLGIKNDMGGSQYPTICGDHESSCSAVCHVDADNCGHKSFTSFFLRQRFIGLGLPERSQ
jgi:hypothetical protein